MNKKDFFPNLYLPAEWSKHRATLMCWPANRELFGSHYYGVLIDYENLVKVVNSLEPVRLITSPQDYDYVRERLKDIRCQIEIIPIEIDDTWVRDNGPMYVNINNKSQCIVRWKFNAWGGKYKKYENDACLPLAISKLNRIDILEAPLILEGGSICTDGIGTLLTTESVILNSNRNPGLTKKEAELIFQKYLGIKKVIWLRSGLYGDETDGHIDNIAAFTSKGVVTALGCKDKDDYNYEILRENISILEHETDAHGKNLSIHVIEQPDPIFENERRLTASYINFYFVNGGLIFPIFNQKKDKIALDAIKKIVENRKIIPIRSDRLILGGGGIHCMTQQWPI